MMWGWSFCLLPILYLFPILPDAISEQNQKQLLLPCYFIGVLGMGGRGLFIQVFFKGNRTKETSPSSIWGQSRGREGHGMLNTELSGPLDLRGDTR